MALNKYDLDGDGYVGLRDYRTFKSYYGSRTVASDPMSVRCDFNGDGKIDEQDFILFSRAFHAQDWSPYIIAAVTLLAIAVVVPPTVAYFRTRPHK